MEVVVPGPSWIDPQRIAEVEAEVRREQAAVLGDVLALFDRLTSLFMPASETRVHFKEDPALPALTAIESGLFGHVRTARTAVVDGRIENVAMILRTIADVKKRTELCTESPRFAARVMRNKPIPQADLDLAYDKLLAKRAVARGQPAPERKVRGGRAAGRAVASDVVSDIASPIIHAQHNGLQFMAHKADATSVVVRRAPAGREIPDRGRNIALALISTAYDSLRIAAPILLRAQGIDLGEWEKRRAAFEQGLGRAATPYFVQRAASRRRPPVRLTVSARGVLLEDGQPVSAARAQELAG